MAKAVLTRLWQSLLHEFVFFVVELGPTQILRNLSIFFCLHRSRSILFWIFSQGSQSQPKTARSWIFSRTDYIVSANYPVTPFLTLCRCEPWKTPIMEAQILALWEIWYFFPTNLLNFESLQFPITKAIIISKMTRPLPLIPSSYEYILQPSTLIQPNYFKIPINEKIE